MPKILIDGRSLTIEQVVQVARNKDYQVELDPRAISKINAARKVVEDALKENKVIYGLTTGFGFLKNVHIDNEKAVQLQENLIRSHSVGFGNAFPEEVVRAAMLIRVNSLSSGHSGIRLETLLSLLEMLNKGVYPFVPEKGSLGASGDLAPLSHLILCLMGEGECFAEGKRVPASDELARLSIKPVKLVAKEGLALINGTSFMTALMTLAVDSAKRIEKVADVAAGLSVETMMGSSVPFNKCISELRPHPGQLACAENVRRLIAESEIVESHKNCDRVQDSYTLRCVPQIHGACRDAVSYVKSVVERELNSVTDNPLIFPDKNEVFSGGNFHGEPLALAADTLSMAMAELANVSERRLAKMIDPATSEGLPAFLVPKEHGGVSSGFMIVQYSAAALVSENKVLAHPSSVDSIPTSANQEDHVSMGMNAARHVTEIIKNVWQVLASEIMASAQAADFKKPLQLGRGSKIAYEIIREKITFIEKDRILYKDIDTVREIIKNEYFLMMISKQVGELL